jgi:hypothetical protein
MTGSPALLVVAKGAAETTRLAAMLSAVGADQTKKITLYGDTSYIAGVRREVGSAALACGVTVVSFEEHSGPISTKLVVALSGHPRRIRDFHDLMRGDGLSTDSQWIIDGVVIDFAVGGFRSLRRKWQDRNDPPLDSGPDDPFLRRTTVYWRWEQEGSDGEGIGAVWVDTYDGKGSTPVSSEQWPQSARRSEALSYAQEHGFAFFPDEY